MKTFVVYDEQEERAKNWHKRCKKKAGTEKFTFIPNGIGMGLIYTCKCGKELDLSEYDKW